jgi:MATE family multidrug resistance protein
MLQMGMESASFALSAFYVGWLGTASLAAHNIMNTVGQLCFMLYYGMAAAVAVQVSYYRGAGNLGETKRVAQAGLYLTWAMALVFTLPIVLFRARIGPLFTSSSDVAALVEAVVPVFAVYQLGDALQCIYGNALRGMADVKPLIPMAFIAYFLISLPLGYLFGFIFDWGFIGVWMAFPFGLTSAGLMYWRRFQKQ